ncbi:unnamed protein product [Adineta ricciae]|uniref:SH3 domain-containing protein n=1 Tax=Adineta ricciae TaxID=249248 RepID=A0A815TKL2_ADIRI|nr:unnamed protein product [Adineta ricciae]
MQLAVALYNNDVDDEDELEFRKGDILTVLIENPNGFDGWWLCKHKNKCGLCPENRLKLIQNPTTCSATESNDFVQYCPRLSTLSMYDSLYNQQTIDSLNHDYDNQQKSDFISDGKSLDSSPETSSRSSGIYSTNELQFSSSSSIDFHSSTASNDTLSLFELNQLQNSFKQLFICSSLTDKYLQLISHTNSESLIKSFVTECYLFLQNYGCLLDRHTYRLIKETFLYETEHNDKHIIQSSTKIIQLIKLTIDLRLKERNQLSSAISSDVFKKLHLEPSDDISTAHIYQKRRSSAAKSSPRLSSDFLTPASSYKSIHQDEQPPVPNPLMKCYYRHINEQIDSILKRYSRLSECEQNSTSLVASEGKALVVAGHKLVFVLETLHEHLQQIRTPLISLTTQLRQSLTTTIQLLKQLSQQNCTNMSEPLLFRFQLDIQMIIDIVKRIKHNCRLS